jgi:peroxiredoxin
VAQHKSEFERRGIGILVVSCAEPSNLALYQKRHQWPFPVFADPGRKAYQIFTLPKLSLWRVFSPSTLRLYRQLMRRGMQQERYGGADIFQSGGDFLLDREGNILYAHRGKNPADRPTVSTLLKEIDRLR